MMTVKELIKKLRKLPQDTSVFTFDGEYGELGVSKVNYMKEVWSDKSVSRKVVLS